MAVPTFAQAMEFLKIFRYPSLPDNLTQEARAARDAEVRETESILVIAWFAVEQEIRRAGKYDQLIAGLNPYFTRCISRHPLTNELYISAGDAITPVPDQSADSEQWELRHRAACLSVMAMYSQMHPDHPCLGLPRPSQSGFPRYDGPAYRGTDDDERFRQSHIARSVREAAAIIGSFCDTEISSVQIQYDTNVATVYEEDRRTLEDITGEAVDLLEQYPYLESSDPPTREMIAIVQGHDVHRIVQKILEKLPGSPSQFPRPGHGLWYRLVNLSRRTHPDENTVWQASNDFAEWLRATYLTTADDAGKLVTLEWISRESGIPANTLRGPKWKPILWPPDSSERGQPNQWSITRAREFVRIHGRPK